MHFYYRKFPTKKFFFYIKLLFVNQLSKFLLYVYNIFGTKSLENILPPLKETTNYPQKFILKWQNQDISSIKSAEKTAWFWNIWNNLTNMLL